MQTGNVEHAVVRAHVGVWDGSDPGLDHVGDLVGVFVLPWFLGGTVANAFAAEVDIFVATGGVGGGHGGLEGELDAGAFAWQGGTTVS